ncbi:histidinol dehydrogenase [candidate division KSB1 bacterium]|nr:histidinol dehydrogenase [candidate division KSB1 bacterium]
MKITQYDKSGDTFFRYKELEELTSVKQVLNEVRQFGDPAVKKYTRQFDGVALEHLKIEHATIETAYHQEDARTLVVLEAAAQNIRIFAERQLAQLHDFEFEIQPGVFTGQKVIPIERVGVYVPGGRFPLVSTLLMCAIPAKVAGVSEIMVCSPPTHEDSIHPTILAAAKIAGVEEVYQIGGAQAIGAMAYGTQSIKPVDKIVGPGNKYVAYAKKEVYGIVGIDFIAGPTEVLILADESANPAFIAADLLAQAEHDPDAASILVTASLGLAYAVLREVDRQLEHLSTKAIAEQSLENNGRIILVERFEEAVELANRMAPEHLELHVSHPEKYIAELKHYGSLFIGNYAAEVLGDYSSGLNHTLPTNTTARYTGGLSVKDFLKFQTTLNVTSAGLQTIGPTAEELGKLEALSGHVNAVTIRLAHLTSAH